MFQSLTWDLVMDILFYTSAIYALCVILWVARKVRQKKALVLIGLDIGLVALLLLWSPLAWAGGILMYALLLHVDVMNQGSAGPTAPLRRWARKLRRR